MTNDKDFSFDRLDQLAKACADTINADGKVSTDEFLAVIKEIRKIFDVLGSIVSLAFQDIDKKIGEIKDAKTVEETSFIHCQENLRDFTFCCSKSLIVHQFCLF